MSGPRERHGIRLRILAPSSLPSVALFVMCACRPEQSPPIDEDRPVAKATSVEDREPDSPAAAPDSPAAEAKTTTQAKSESEAKPAPEVKPPVGLPVHGLASLDSACEQLMALANDRTPRAGFECDPGDADLVIPDADFGLLPLVAVMTIQFPVVEVGGIWSVFPPVVEAWDSGTEVNQSFDESLFSSAPNPRWGELLELDLTTTTTDDFDDWVELTHVRTKVYCVRGSDRARCTAPIEVLSVRERQSGSRSPKLLERRETKLQIDGDDLVESAGSRVTRKPLAELLEPRNYEWGPRSPSG